MRTRSRNPFTTVKTAGLLLPIDLLSRIADGDRDLAGLTPESYHLDPGERLNEAATRAWNVCLSAWKVFRQAAATLPASDAGTTLTRDRWLLTLFKELGYGRLQAQKAIEIEDKTYPISHGWSSHIPVHLVSFRYELERRTPGAAGAATRSPYSLMQELLNRSTAHRWGFLSNGLRLFILRDNASLSRAANVEFDLEAMFEGEVYADFLLLFLVCHQSRVETPVDGKADNCWLEKWSKLADDQGTRAREKLRVGVEESIKALGAGFLTTQGNSALQGRLRSGELPTQDYYRQLLRLVYRLLLLLVAEEKRTEDGQNLLHSPGTPEAVRRRYSRFYSVGRLRTLATLRRGTAHADLYASLKVLFEKLRAGYEPLGIPALGSFLFSDSSTPDLDAASLSNEALLNTIRALCITEDTSGRGGTVRRPVDFANLGSDELGSVYESLLELHPLIDSEAGPFTLGTASGNERKTSGSYYTPTSLINCLLDSALDPVVREALNKPDAKQAEQALLSLKLCDPACGSGHFLIAAADRLARHLASLRTGDDEPSALMIQQAKRDIIGHCIYGVDINPMSVELCKVALWMEAMEPGKPLSFLDHHIQCGNSLLGTTPALLAKGVPDDAFTAIEGDVKARVASLKKQNKSERPLESGKRQRLLGDVPFKLGNIAADFARLNTAPDGTLAEVAALQEQYARLVSSSDYESTRLLADTWCAAFVWKKDDSDDGKMCPTERDFRKVESHAGAGLLPHVREEVERLRDQYQFFHWHLAFPDVFRLPGKDETPDNEQTGWSGGFDVVLGNPPWERVSFEDKQFFADKAPAVAAAKTTTARKRLISDLEAVSPQIFAQYQSALRAAEAETLLLTASGFYPNAARGRVNTYAIFTELAHYLLNLKGACGIIVPTGVATDEPLKELFQFLLNSSLRSLFDFENSTGIFPSVHRSFKFCLLTSAKGRTAEAPADFAFFLTSVEQLRDDSRHLKFSAADLKSINPLSSTCPILRNQKDALLLRRAHATYPIWILHTASNQADYDLLIMFISESGSEHYRDQNWLEQHGYEFDPESKIAVAGQVSYLPLFEAKLIHQFDCAFAEYRGTDVVDVASDVNRPRPLPQPRFWVPANESEKRYESRGWNSRWAMAFRGVARSTDVRTAIACVLPRVPMMQHLYTILPRTPDHALYLESIFNSFAFDYIARLKVPSINLNFTTLRQLPLIPFESSRGSAFWPLIASCALELTYTAWDLEPFARDCGYAGPPFRWDEERRFLLRAELDAAFFHLYGLNRDDTAYILDTFPIVRRKDIAQHGEYRTQRVILEIYDALTESTRTGQPYQTRLDPPPADPRVAHPPKAT